MKQEIWKDVKGYENIYKVSDIGRIKSLDRIDSNNRRVKGRVLKLRHDKDGYVTVELSNKNKGKTMKVHRLVALAFVPNPSNLPQVNHINEIKHDNRVFNLEWSTSRQNKNHSSNRHSSSKHSGVSFNKKSQKWQVRCGIGFSRKYIGMFTDELEAAKAYQDFCEKHNLK